MMSAASTDVREIPFALGYFVDPRGQVYSRSRCWRGTYWRGYSYRQMAPKRNPQSGYLFARFTINGKRRCYPVHMIVATVFHGDRPSPEHQVRHLDGNPLNNTVTNLCWGTPKENSADRVRHGHQQRGEQSPKAKLTESAVRDILLSSREGMSGAALAARYGVTKEAVYAVRLRKVWKHVVV